MDADLGAQGRNFAATIKDLLNKTVCNGAHVGSTVIPDKRQVNVGTRLTEKSPLTAGAVGIGIDGKKPRVWLTVQYKCYIDDDGYLTVYTSLFAISADAEERMMLCHYDYERHKDGYPAAHLQVAGLSPAFEALADLCQQKTATGLKKLHFPVGGRRFRPCLEDVIEFMIVEGLAAGRTGWEAAVEAGREVFLENQLKAAVRRHPEVAKAALSKHPPS